jgi:hypothetical protein
MILRCKASSLKNLNISEDEIPNIFCYKYEFAVDPGQDYTAMGIMVSKDNNNLSFLVDDGYVCHWTPAPLFEIVDPSLPKNWYISLYDKRGNGDLFIVMGFYELCNDADFHDDMFERESYAMEIYFQRKLQFQKDL